MLKAAEKMAEEFSFDYTNFVDNTINLRYEDLKNHFFEVNNKISEIKQRDSILSVGRIGELKDEIKKIMMTVELRKKEKQLKKLKIKRILKYAVVISTVYGLIFYLVNKLKSNEK